MRWWVSVLSFVLVGTSHSRWARRYRLEATVRPSFAFYNTFEEIDVFLKAVRRIAEGGTNVG
ncbi:hypothetical protein A5621_24765 [Mycobacterium colombiense]|uniref:hypothetical protein n=1 Tax=Mycobacterium colombiense TaxID=339268 RepID=UPI0007FBF824|nr:hypothetical protein [Mycobacterium colombiense]OBJ29145.1 hypothetical protein A5621_24765 [Mycobacterium colombiense]